MRNCHFLIKPSSSLCNMRCRYCFYHDEAANRENPDYGFMSNETAEKLIERAAEFTDGGFVTFAFQGGEPTLRGIDFYRSFIYNANRAFSKDRLSFAIQTNGILIDDEYAKLFHDNGFLVGISIDGPSEFHDLNRIDTSGKGTYGKVDKAIRLLSKHKVDFNCLCVVTQKAAEHPQALYRYFKSRNLRFIQFIPEIAPIGSANSLDPETYGNFLVSVFDLWYDDLIKGNYISIRDFDNYGQIILGREPESCAMRGVCSCNPTVEANGDVYPCDFYVLDDYKLGNVMTDSLSDMIRNENAVRFVRDSAVHSEECFGCRWYPLCRAGCRRNRDASGKQIYCSSYSYFFSRCTDKLRSIPSVLREKYKM